MSCRVGIGAVERGNVSLSSSFRWKIQDFSHVNVDVGSSVLSPVFTTADSSVKWHLKLYPNGKTQRDREYLSISVYYCSEIETDASYELSIANAYNNEVLDNFVIRKQLTLVADFESQEEAWIPYRFHPMILKRSFIQDPKNCILTDDCLTITFDLILQDPSIPDPASNNEHLKDDRLKEFDDFEKLLDNEQFSDVTFVIGDQKIQAHKAILTARSPVFEEKFMYNATDNEHKTVIEIADVEYPVLIELFRFLYTGIVNDAYSMADDLFAVADKYCVEGLKSLCEKTLSAHLKVDNVLELFTIADVRRAKILKERVLEFIAEHADEIVEQDEFASLRPHLMHEIVRIMARKKLITESQ